MALAACTGSAPDVAPGSSVGDDPPSTAVVSNHRWSARLRAGDGIELVNHLGDLRVRSSGDSGLHYAGVVQQLDGEAREPEFRTDRTPEALRLMPVADSDWHGRVDGGVRVPAGSPLRLVTSAGAIDVRTGNNDVVAESTTGRISVRSDGRIEASSESGDIRVVLFGDDYAPGVAGKVISRSGNIELWVQPSASLSIEALGVGGVNVDTGKAKTIIEPVEGGARVVVGDGHAEVHVESTDGSVSVNLLPAGP